MKVTGGSLTRVVFQLAGPVIAWGLLGAVDLHAQASKPTEYEVKAAYLSNFGRFVDWPARAGQTFNVCVLGHDPFGAALDAALAGETIGGATLFARRMSAPQGSLNFR